LPSSAFAKIINNNTSPPHLFVKINQIAVFVHEREQHGTVGLARVVHKVWRGILMRKGTKVSVTGPGAATLSETQRRSPHPTSDSRQMNSVGGVECVISPVERLKKRASASSSCPVKPMRTHSVSSFPGDGDVAMRC
jgi:hypothetical protein